VTEFRRICPPPSRALPSMRMEAKDICKCKEWSGPDSSYSLAMIIRRLFSTARPGLSLSPTIRQLLDSRPGIERIITVSGWIKSVRRQKNVAFAAITDGSDAKGIQAVLLKGTNDELLRRSAFYVSNMLYIILTAVCNAKVNYGRCRSRHWSSGFLAECWPVS